MITIGVDPNISFLHGVSYGTTTNFNITFPYEQPIPPDEFFQDRPLDVAYINLLTTANIGYTADILYLSSHPNEANSALINPTLRNAFSIRPQALNTNTTYSVMVRYGLKVSFTSSTGSKISFLGTSIDTGSGGGRVFAPPSNSNIAISLPSQNTWVDIDYRCILAYSGSAWQITSHKIRYATITGGIRAWGLWAENTSSVAFQNMDSVIRVISQPIYANTQYSFFYPRVAIAPNTNLYNL